ncbi:glycosyltransferase family 2 protein [Empedobacter falsenii]
MSNTNALITIAIPFFNAEKFLEEAIVSVIDQSFTEWVLLLVDDGSTDRSLDIAKAYAAKDERIQVFSDGANKNLGYRLNQIPHLVTTEYLARMDADDIMHPQRIEQQIQTLQNHPSIDVLGTNAYTIDEKGAVVGIRYATTGDQKLVQVEAFIHPTIVAKTSWFRMHPYDVEAVRVEDAELWYRTKNTSNFMMLLQPLFFYREFGGEYYKKYFKNNTSKKVLLKKYQNDKYWIDFFRYNKLKGYVYYFASLINKENFLILKRNKVIFKNKINVNKFLNAK